MTTAAVSYGYDAITPAGNKGKGKRTRNLNLATQQNLTWDHENRLSNSSGGGLPSESYLYDRDGQRVKKTSAGVATYFVNPFYETSGATITKYYYLNGQRVIMRTNAGGSWSHYDLYGDHLGSTVLVTNQGGGTVSNQGYYAFGRYRYGDTLATDYKFTGQKLDATGLYFYGARYYDPTLGRFIGGPLSADTIVPGGPLGAGDVAAFDRYAYVLNNLLRYRDPTGHQSTCAMDADKQHHVYRQCGNGRTDFRH